MNLGFNSHLRAGLYFFLVSPSVWLRVLEGKQKSNSSKPAALSNEAPVQKFLTGCWRASSVLFEPWFSVNCCLIPVCHVRISEKEAKAHQKEQYFLAHDTICGKHFPFMVMARKQMTAQKNRGSKNIHSLHCTEMQPERLNRKVRNWNKSALTLWQSG